MKKSYNVRSLAAQLIEQVVDKHQSLSSILPKYQTKLADKDSALLQELTFGVTRHLSALDTIIQQLMNKPMSGQQKVIHYLLMVGIYQLAHTRIPAHAALAETVEGSAVLKRHKLKGLVNGVLREFQRQQATLLENTPPESCNYLHPVWLLAVIKRSWPENWQQILNANNQRPPMWLRVNRLHHRREQWLAQLHHAGIEGDSSPLAEDAVYLNKAVPVNQLPGFDLGHITVQDVSAQRCAIFLAPQNGEQILDLCAAPGGKTTHILEIAPKAAVTAVDVDPKRLQRVIQNLQRLRMTADVKQGDGRYPQQWCEGQRFDRILLDAPCSATGVIRRHPDIKWLRRESDIGALVKLQQEILEAIWPYLKVGGTLIYATCSVLPAENYQQIQNFIARYPDAIPQKLPSGQQFGLQVFPDEMGGDGFFYAKIVKAQS